MPKSSAVNALRAALRLVIIHDEQVPKKEKLFAPTKDFTIAFFLEGGFRVAGDCTSLRINLNHPQLLILILAGAEDQRIYRFPWMALIGFELVRKSSPWSKAGSVARN